jgi:hypothetical protein
VRGGWRIDHIVKALQQSKAHDLGFRSGRSNSTDDNDKRGFRKTERSITGAMDLRVLRDQSIPCSVAPQHIAILKLGLFIDRHAGALDGVLKLSLPDFANWCFTTATQAAYSKCSGVGVCVRWVWLSGSGREQCSRRAAIHLHVYIHI